MRFQCIIYLLLFICISKLYGQQLFFRHLDLAIPSQECYNIIQDHHGYIWISTDEGLCKYDGNYLKVFGKKEGLPELSCYWVKEAPSGDIWMTTSDNRFLVYKNDSLYESPVSRLYREKFQTKFEQIYAVDLVDTSIYLHSQYDTYKANISGHLERVKAFSQDTAYCFVKTSGTILPQKKASYPRVLLRSLKIIIQLKGGIQEIEIPYSGKSSPHWRGCTAMSRNGTGFISIGDKMVALYPDGTYELLQYPNRILNIYCDKDDGLWIGTYKKGVYYYPDVFAMNKSIISLPDLSITGICEDDERGIWCTTLERGVFYTANKSILSYNNIIGMDRRAEMLESLEGNVFVSSISGEIVRMSQDMLYNIQLSDQLAYPMSDIEFNGKEYLIAGKDELVRADDKLTAFSQIEFRPKGLRTAAASQIVKGPEGKYYGLLQGGLNEVNGLISEEMVPGSMGITCIYNYNSKFLLAGTRDGLYKISFDHFSVEKMEGITDHIIKITPGLTNEVWIITRHSGIFMMKEDIFYSLNKFFFLPTNKFFDILVDGNRVMWIGSNLGLIRIDRGRSNPTLALYNSSNGLPSNEIYKLAADSNHLYISTIEGVSRFPLKMELKNNSDPKIFVRSFQVNDRPVDFMATSTLSFSHHENSLRIKTSILSFKGSSSSGLLYMLKGPTDEYHYQQSNEIILGNLSPGIYELTVYAINNDGKMSDHPVVLSFEIRKPFWATIGFIAGSALLFVIILFIVINRTIFNIRRKEREKTRMNKLMAEYQLTALQAQMNPHFIFNAINSIQTYILDNHPQEAYNYLAKFAKLVRLVLYHAKDKTLALEKEIEILTTYIMLEQLRFTNKFSFELTVDPKIDLYETELPPMLLQPYVENAISHGLAPLKASRMGLLKIDMRKVKEVLLITIEDNGVGREYTKSIRKPEGYTSMGMVLTTQRMDLLRNIWQYVETKVEITDLYQDQKPVGTRVEIFVSTDPDK